MNERQTSEGERIKSIFADDRTAAQKLLDKCKKREKSKHLISVALGRNTTYLVPEGKNLTEWKERKQRNLDRARNNY